MLLIIYLILFISGLTLITNKVVKKKCVHQVPDIFDLNNRNYDMLIIGERCRMDDSFFQNRKCLFLTAPGRTFYASKLIFQRMHSFLKEENGKVVFVVKKNKRNNKVSVFDIPFLHQITLKKMYIDKDKLKFPFIYEPLNSIRWLIRPRKVKEIDRFFYDIEIDSFCKERKIEYEFILIS